MTPDRSPDKSDGKPGKTYRQLRYNGERSPEKMRDDNVDQNYYDAINTCP